VLTTWLTALLFLPIQRPNCFDQFPVFGLSVSAVFSVFTIGLSISGEIVGTSVKPLGRFV